MPTPQEFRVYGPPGTGKTTWISKQIKRAVQKYPSKSVYACSFTRAAAEELVQKDVLLPRSNVGTIHSLCYHQLGCPPIAETEPDIIEEWNERHPADGLTCEGQSILDEPVEADERAGDWLRRWNLERNQNPEAEATGVAWEWEQFKEETGCVDFTDLLLKAPPDLPHLSVLMVDEAQDLTPLQLEAVRSWGKDANTFVMVGDDDQVLFRWMGASPDHLLTPIPEEQKRVLSHSYRLPRRVHEKAHDWIQKLEDRREEKEFTCTDREGEVNMRGLNLDSPRALVSEAQDRDGTVMILASCSYMLNGVITELRKQGVPFHNPYRRNRGDWNPLRSTTKRVANFLTWMDHPTAENLWSWIKMIRATDNLHHGAKTEIEEYAKEGRDVADTDIERWLKSPDLINACMDGDVDWLRENVTSQYTNGLEFPIKIAKKSGTDALVSKPNIIVGTYHSVKGGQADHVYLFPDISPKAYKGLQGHNPVVRERKDDLIRQFYVGMTRAKESLHLCQPKNSKLSVPWR